MIRAAGRRRTRVRLQYDAGATRNSFGEVVEDWTDYATVSAEVEPLDGSEPFTSRLQMDEQAVRFTLDYGSEWSALKPKDRILVGSVVHDLASVVNVENRNRQLQCIGVVRG